MENAEPTKQLADIGELIRTVWHIAIATVNADGTPHNTVVFAGCDQDLNYFWCSTPDTRHSQNIARTGECFVMVYHSHQSLNGLYLQAEVTALEGEELARGLEVYNRARQRLAREAVPLQEVQPDAEQRLYRAHPLTFWTSTSERNAEGRIIRDQRHPLTLEQLQEVLY